MERAYTGPHKEAEPDMERIVTYRASHGALVPDADTDMRVEPHGNAHALADDQGTLMTGSLEDCLDACDAILGFDGHDVAPMAAPDRLVCETAPAIDPDDAAWLEDECGVGLTVLSDRTLVSGLSSHVAACMRLIAPAPVPSPRIADVPTPPPPADEVDDPVDAVPVLLGVLEGDVKAVDGHDGASYVIPADADPDEGEYPFVALWYEDGRAMTRFGVARGHGVGSGADLEEPAELGTATLSALSHMWSVHLRSLADDDEEPVQAAVTASEPKPERRRATVVKRARNARGTPHRPIRASKALAARCASVEATGRFGMDLRLI